MAQTRHSPYFSTIFCTLVLFLCTSHSVESRRQRYLTGYACEGSQLSISCEQPDQHIQLVRSNFGRFSISICNAHGQLNWSVNCHSPNSARLIAESCNGHRHCLLQATTEFFGDPCPETHKYLEVHYQCVSNQATSSSSSAASSASSSGASSSSISSSSQADTNAAVNSAQSLDSISGNLGLVQSSGPSSVSAVTPPPPPPIIIPTVNPLVKPQPQQQASSSQRLPVDQSSSSVFDSRDSGRAIFVSHPYPREPDLSANHQPSSASFDAHSNHVDESSQHFRSSVTYCPSLFARGLAWNRTAVGQVVTQPCPPGSSGIAQWFCSAATSTSGQPSAQWVPSQPVFAQCQSSWLAQLKLRVSAGDSALLLSAELATLLGEVSQMHGGDVRGVAELLRLLLQPLESLMANNRLQQQKGLTEEMLTSMESICSHLLDNKHQASWLELSPTDRKSAAAHMIYTLQKSAMLYGESVQERYHDYVRVHSHLYIGLHLRSVEHLENDLLLPVDHTQSVNEQRPAMFDPLQHNLRQNHFSGNSIRISAAHLRPHLNQATIQLLLTMYKNLDSILEPELIRESSEIQSMRSLSNATNILNSNIIGVRITNEQSVPLRLLDSPATDDSIASHLNSNNPLLRLQFRHLLTSNVTNARCVHWNNELRQWSAHGCQLMSSNRSHSTCACQHVHGHFALLMDLNEQASSSSSDANTNSVAASSSSGSMASINNHVLEPFAGWIGAGLSSPAFGNHANTGHGIIIERVLSPSLRAWLLIGCVFSALLCIVTLLSLCTRLTSSQPTLGVMHSTGCNTASGACAYAGVKPIGRSRLLQRQLSVWLFAQQTCFAFLLTQPTNAWTISCSTNTPVFGWYALLGWHSTTLAAFACLLCAAFELLRLLRGVAVNSSGRSTVVLHSAYAVGPAILALAALLCTVFVHNHGSCSQADSRLQLSAFVLLSALCTLAAVLAFSAAAWRRLSRLQSLQPIGLGGCSSTDLSAVKYAPGPLVPPTNGSAGQGTLQPALSTATLPSFANHQHFAAHHSTLHHSHALGASPNTCYVGCASRKPRLLLFANVSITLLCVADVTLVTLFVSNHFRRLDAFLAVCNACVGPLLFAGFCLSRSPVRHLLAEWIGRLRRKLNCFRRTSKSNLLAGAALDQLAASAAHNNGNSLNGANRKNGSILDNPLIGGSGNKYVLDSAASAIETGSDYGCRRLQLHANGSGALVASNNNNNISNAAGSITIAGNGFVQQASNQHLYQLYGAKSNACNAFSGCPHGVIEHVYECIDEEPYVAKLLMAAAAAANNGQPILNYGGNQAAAASKLLAYRTLQMPRRCNMTLNAQQQSAQQQPQQQQMACNDRPLIGAQQATLGASRLAMLPAIVKDNNGRTTVICARSSQDLRDTVEQNSNGPLASKVMLNSSANDQGIDI